MGYYIECSQPKGKAQELIKKHGAVKMNGPSFDPTGFVITVCVVDNGPFEAAGIAYDKDEFIRFADYDGRPRTWLAVPRTEVVKLCPEVERMLPQVDINDLYPQKAR